MTYLALSRRAHVLSTPSLFQTVKNCTESKLIITARVWTVVTAAALGATSLIDNLIAINTRPRSIQPFEAIVMSIKQLCNGPSTTSAFCTYLGMCAMNAVDVGGKGDVVAGVVLERVLRTRNVQLMNGLCKDLALDEWRLTLRGCGCQGIRRDPLPDYSSAEQARREVRRPAGHGLDHGQLLGSDQGPCRSPPLHEESR